MKNEIEEIREFVKSTEGHHSFTRFNLEIGDIRALLKKLDQCKLALSSLALCKGGCEGPMGCMCSAPTAKRCLKEEFGVEK